MPARLTQNIQNALLLDAMMRFINTFSSLLPCSFLHYRITSIVHSLPTEDTI